MNKELIFAALIAVLLHAGACTNRNVKSGHEKRMEAVSEEIASTRKHDRALLLVTFGSTWDGPQKTFATVQESFRKKFPDMDVYFSFTSQICIRRCAEKGLTYYDPSFYLTALGQAGYKEICMQSLHVIPGEEFLRLKNEAKDFHNNADHPEFEKIKVCLGGPLLDTKEDVCEIAALLDKSYSDEIKSGKTVTFMGHGNPESDNYGNGNSRYTLLEQELQKFDKGYFVGTVDMENNLVSDVIARMKEAGRNQGEIICHPLMSIAGDHANNDMKGGTDEMNPEEGSWRYEFEKAGYKCPLSNCHVRGLAEYPEIVNIWMKHTERALKEPLF